MGVTAGGSLLALFYLPAGMRASTSLGNWSWLMRSSILNTNLGVWAFTICRMPGPNSWRTLIPAWRTLIPASPPIVVPKLLNAPEVERAQYGRLAVAIATEVSAPRKYEVFSLLFPESSRVMNQRHSIESGKAGLRSGSEMFRFGFAHQARVDSYRAKYQGRAGFIDERLKFFRLRWRLERRSIGKGFPRTHLPALHFE